MKKPGIISNRTSNLYGMIFSLIILAIVIIIIWNDLVFGSIIAPDYEINWTLLTIAFLVIITLSVITGVLANNYYKYIRFGKIIDILTPELDDLQIKGFTIMCQTKKGESFSIQYIFGSEETSSYYLVSLVSKRLVPPERPQENGLLRSWLDSILYRYGRTIWPQPKKNEKEIIILTEDLIVDIRYIHSLRTIKLDEFKNQIRIVANLRHRMVRSIASDVLKTLYLLRNIEQTLYEQHLWNDFEK
jgi:hypothetical protein